MKKEESSKAYNKALEAARKEISVYRKEHPVLERVLYNIFPELSENEDERIRKGLVNFLQSPFIKDNLTDEKVAPWLSYLEKQKEQKPTPDWMPKFLDELRSKKNYFDWDEHRDIEGHILAIINWIEPNYFKRKEEQKPAEWSEECIADVFEKVGLAKIVREQANDALTNAVQSAMIELSKTGNAEWSEEKNQKLRRESRLNRELAFFQ